MPAVPTPNITFNGSGGVLQFNANYRGTSLSANRGIAIAAGQSGTLDVQGNTISYAGQISTGSAASNFQVASSSGGGTLIVSANQSYNGATTVASGTLELVTATTNNIPNSAKIDVKSGAVLDVSQVSGSGGFTLTGGQILEGKGTINGGVTVAAGGILAPGESVGTLSGTALLLASGAILDYEFNATPANDFFQSTNLNGLTINGGGFNLYEEGTTNPFDAPGTYHLLGYSGALRGAGISALAVLDPQPGFTYAFSNNLALDEVRSNDRGGARAGNLAIGDPGGRGPLPRAIQAAAAQARAQLPGNDLIGIALCPPPTRGDSSPVPYEAERPKGSAADTSAPGTGRYHKTRASAQYKGRPGRTRTYDQGIMSPLL